MSTTPENFIIWAQSEPTVSMVTLIGSRARPIDAPDGPREHSDWDFHVATTTPGMFATPEWLAAIDAQPIAYVHRTGVTGVVNKVTAVFADGEVEWVIIPADPFNGMAQAVAAGALHADPMIPRMLAELGKVLFGYYRIIKGAEAYSDVYEVAQQLGASGYRLDDAEVISLANGFVCDYVSMRRKITRGEFRAAQLLLFTQLVDALYSMLFELRVREGLNAKPQARRLEEAEDPRLPLLTFELTLDEASLREATDKAADALRSLTTALVGSQWAWPDLTPLHLE